MGGGKRLLTGRGVERAARVELASLAWEARVIPIYDARLGGDIHFSMIIHINSFVWIGGVSDGYYLHQFNGKNISYLLSTAVITGFHLFRSNIGTLLVMAPRWCSGIRPESQPQPTSTSWEDSYLPCIHLILPREYTRIVSSGRGSGSGEYSVINWFVLNSQSNGIQKL